MKIIENGHLTAESLTAFFAGTLSDDEILELCEHTADCPNCALRLADIPDADLKTPPKAFSELVILKIKDTEQRLPKREFKNYCIRVAACAAVTIFILFAGVSRFPKSSVSLSDTKPQITGTLKAPDKLALPEPQKFTIQQPKDYSKGTVWDQFGNWYSGMVDTIFNSEESHHD